PINFQDAMRKLVDGVPGIRVDLDFNARLGEIQAAETLLRCTREALTNVLRHSGANRCVISFSENDTDYRPEIRHNGQGRENIVPGNGRNGIMDRIVEDGGLVQWFCHNGFVFSIRFPASRSANDGALAATETTLAPRRAIA